MSVLNKWLGFRWSLYIAQNGTQLVYAMHENSVMRIVGYVMGYFANGAQPVPPWSLYLNFNHTHKTIQLRREVLRPTGDNITNRLITDIEAIDPGWKVKGAEPIFEEAATKRRLKITEHRPGHIDLQGMMDSLNKPGEVTFYSVMDEGFGKS